MLRPPTKSLVRVQHTLGDVATGLEGVTVPTGASAGTKGTLTALLTLAFDVHWIEVNIANIGTANSRSGTCLDILVGDGITQDLLIENLLSAGAANGNRWWGFPLYVPAGLGLLAQVASHRTSINSRVNVVCYGWNSLPPFRVGTRVTTYGVSSVPDGTPVTQGTSESDGSWTQIAASSSRDHFAFQLGVSVGNSTAWNTTSYGVDIGIGAATEEQIGGRYFFHSTANEALGAFNPWPTWHEVPSGTRLAVRATQVGTGSLPLETALYGVS